MKKLMLSAFFIGLVATSCGSKESKISSESDSMNITADSMPMRDSMPMVDSATMQTDTMKMPIDTMNTPMK